MRDSRLDSLARVLVHHSVAVRRGDLVTIVGEPAALPAVEALFRAVLAAGGHPSFHPRSESLQEALLDTASANDLGHVCPFERFRLEHADVLIVLRAPINTRFLGKIDPARAAAMQAARRELAALSMTRAAQGHLRYVLAEVPTQAAAQEAHMSLDQYADLVFRAGFLHLPDPVESWRRQRTKQESLLARLRRTRSLRFVVPGNGEAEGTDVTVGVSGRTWVNCAGEQNFPDGEVFTGPQTVNGVLCLTGPATYLGKEVDGVRLEFRDGRVVGASASRNEAFLIAMLDQDSGARVAGELGIGTNENLTEILNNAFFDEKVAGTFHIALGSGYPETGNTNQSGLHWDMVCDLRGRDGPGGTIEADGEIIQRHGRFVDGMK